MLAHLQNGDREAATMLAPFTHHVPGMTRRPVPAAASEAQWTRDPRRHRPATGPRRPSRGSSGRTGPSRFRCTGSRSCASHGELPACAARGVRRAAPAVGVGGCRARRRSRRRGAPLPDRRARYERLDGAAQEEVPDPPAIEAQPDGPLYVRGCVHVVNQDGAERELPRAALCRCGESNNKPFCDGMHRRSGFRTT